MDQKRRRVDELVIDGPIQQSPNNDILMFENEIQNQKNEFMAGAVMQACLGL